MECIPSSSGFQSIARACILVTYIFFVSLMTLPSTTHNFSLSPSLFQSNHTHTHTRARMHAILGFEDADFNAEQDLRWGTVYSQYVDWLENQLDQFCESQGCTVEEVFAKLKECMKGENSSFMPMFMQNTEYEHFLGQMKYYANQKKTEKQVKKALESKKDKERRKSKTLCVNFSGQWVVDQSVDHKDSVEEYMEASGVPWIYRKIFSHAATSKYLKLFIEQNGDKSIRVVFRYKFFGGTDLTVNFDEEVVQKSIWREERRWKVTLDKEKRTMNMHAIKDRPLPKNVLKKYSFWKMGPYEETLMYTKCLEMKGGKTLKHVQHFVRADSAPSSK